MVRPIPSRLFRLAHARPAALQDPRRGGREYGPATEVLFSTGCFFERCCMSHRYLCERCGGIGQQESGCWDGTAYQAPAGKCDTCHGVGYLGFVEVTQTAFFAAIGQRDCHPCPVGKFPYTSQFFTPNRELLGASVGDSLGGSRYYLPTGIGGAQ